MNYIAKRQFYKLYLFIRLETFMKNIDAKSALRLMESGELSYDHVKCSITVRGMGRCSFSRPIIAGNTRKDQLIPVLMTTLFQLSLMDQIRKRTPTVEYSIIIWIFLCLSGSQMHVQFLRQKFIQSM